MEAQDHKTLRGVADLQSHEMAHEVKSDQEITRLQRVPFRTLVDLIITRKLYCALTSHTEVDPASLKQPRHKQPQIAPVSDPKNKDQKRPSFRTPAGSCKQLSPTQQGMLRNKHVSKREEQHGATSNILGDSE